MQAQTAKGKTENLTGSNRSRQKNELTLIEVLIR